MPHRLLTLAVIVLVALPSAAAAGTWSVDGDTLRFTPAPGQQEWPSVHREPGLFFISDGAAAVTAGPGCAMYFSWARCDQAGVTRVVVDLGDSDDKWNAFADLGVPISVDGGPGNDILEEGRGSFDFKGGDGDDWFVAWDAGGRTTFSGGPGRDRALYNQRDEALRLSLDGVANDGAAGEGDNLLTDVEMVDAGRGADVLTGSAGDDELTGGKGVDEIHGLGGDDILDSFDPDVRDFLYGEAGDDVMRLSGPAYADAGPGDDVFTRGGFSTCSGCVAIGGPGEDTVDFSDDWISDSLTISLDGVANDGPYGASANFGADIENLFGPRDGATLIGGSGPNLIVGGESDDVLRGGGGADTLLGGDGLDFADYSDHAAPVSASLDAQRNDGAAGENDLIEGDVEGLRGGAGADLLVGDDGENVLDGGPGDDVLRGGWGSDTADYSSRADAVRVRLDGRAGSGAAGENDTVDADIEGIVGGAGADLLIGNAGAGVLSGGGGDDRILDPGGVDELDGGAGTDQIDSTDGVRDTVTCGDGTDRLWQDSIDLAGDKTCESVVPGPRPPDPTPTPTPTATPTPTPEPAMAAPAARVAAGPDRTGPRLERLAVTTRARARTLRREGLPLRVRCAEACRVRAELSLRGRVAARGARIALGAGERVVRLRALRRALPAGRYRLTVTLTDQVGNATVVVRSVSVVGAAPER